jgi:hypothetical protein
MQFVHIAVQLTNILCKMGATQEKWVHLERTTLTAIFYRGTIYHTTTKRVCSSVQ